MDWRSVCRRLLRLVTLAIWTLGLVAGPALAGERPRVRVADVHARRWFEDARFGLAIHWGVYSLIGKGESVMKNDRLPASEYEKLLPLFNPTQFNADEWVQLARAAGVRYITVTSKHADGFCLFDSKLTEYDVVDATPYRRDPLKMLAEACYGYGIKLFFSYSLLDWHHPDYLSKGVRPTTTTSGEKPSWARYVAHYQGQIRELCTNYGQIGGFWFDGGWEHSDAEWDLAETYAMIRELQPNALIGFSGRTTPSPGEDFRIARFGDVESKGNGNPGSQARPSSLTLEMGQTLNESLGYTIRDKKYKSADEIVRLLVDTTGRGANLLLSVGPGPDGVFEPEVSERISAVGKWLEIHGEAIYATRRGPVGPQPWGISVRKRGLQSAYLHVLKPVGPVAVPWSLLSYDAKLLGMNKALKMSQVNGELLLDVPAAEPAEVDRVIVLTPKNPLR